jgi:hypothetical protein
MDIGSFLASVIGLETDKYKAIETAFFAGYKSETNEPFPYLSIAIRNFLSIGFSPNLTIFKNMAKKFFRFDMIRNILILAIKLISSCYMGGNSVFLSKPPEPNLQ